MDRVKFCHLCEWSTLCADDLIKHMYYHHFCAITVDYDQAELQRVRRDLNQDLSRFQLGQNYGRLPLYINQQQQQQYQTHHNYFTAFNPHQNQISRGLEISRQAVVSTSGFQNVSMSMSRLMSNMELTPLQHSIASSGIVPKANTTSITPTPTTSHSSATNYRPFDHPIQDPDNQLYAPVCPDPFPRKTATSPFIMNRFPRSPQQASVSNEMQAMQHGISTAATSSHAKKRGREEPTMEQVERKEQLKAFRSKKCPYCAIKFPTIKQVTRHVVDTHADIEDEGVQVGTGTEQVHLNHSRSLFKSAYKVYEADLSNSNIKDINVLFEILKQQVLRAMHDNLKGMPGEKYKSYKIQFDIESKFFKDSDETDPMEFPMESFNFHVENKVYARRVFKLAREHFISRMDDFQQNGSGWVIDRIKSFRIIISEIYRFCGGTHIVDMPTLLKPKYKSLVNVPGNDGLCFQRCVIAAMRGKQYTVKKFNEQTKTLSFYQPYLDGEVKGHTKSGKVVTVDLSTVGANVDLKQMEIFEQLNPSVGINVFVYDENQTSDDLNSRPLNADKDSEVDGETDSENESISSRNVDSGNGGTLGDDRDDVGADHISDNTSPSGKEMYRQQMNAYEERMQHIYPYYVCKEQKELYIDMLLVWEGEKGHYCWIKNYTGFFKSPAHHKVVEICRHCLNNCGKTTYKTHMLYCQKFGLQRLRFPKNKFLYFNKNAATITMPFVFYCDLETQPIPEQKQVGNSKIFARHRATGYAYVLVDEYGGVKESKTYTARNENENVVEQMLEEMLNITEKMVKLLKLWEEKAYDVAGLVLHEHKLPSANDPEPSCYFCDKPVFYKECVRHHEHKPNFEFKGLAHKRCNLNAKLNSSSINAFFHNLKGFDGHFILKASANKKIIETIEVIGGSAEKFFAMKINGCLNIYDSLNFFHSSLTDVVNDLNGDLPITKAHFLKDGRYNDDQVALLLRKQVYPYKYFTTMEKYNETKLPPVEEFYDDLSEKPISQANYDHAQKVWMKLGIKNLREYTELYCETDVFLLADSFQQMRSMFMNEFKLDPAHYLSLPMLSFDCCLKDTGCKLDYITDPTMLAWIELSKRGGVAVGGDIRAFQANNKYLPGYDETKATTFISVQDLVNLYPYCMSMHLPTSDFNWVEGEEWEELQRNPESFIKRTGPKAEKGYMYEVDIIFPEDTHDYFSKATPAPYRRKTMIEELSDRQAVFTDLLDPTHAALRAERLLCDLHPRKNYIVHYRALQLYVELGMKVTRVHRALKFTQSACFEPYITKLAKKRQAATSDQKKNWYKLAGNVIFGKACEDVRSRVQFKIVRCREEALRYNSKPNVSRVNLLDNGPGEGEIAIVCLRNVSAFLNRPVYIGTACLDLAKMVHYGYHYKVAKPLWDNPAKGRELMVLGSDTDSWFYAMKTDDMYEDILSVKDEFDRSNFPIGHPIWDKYYSKEFQKVPGKMKDELAGKTISHFVYLKPKMYMYKYAEIETVTDPKTKIQEIKMSEHINGEKSVIWNETKKGKGIPKGALKDQCNFEQFVECLEKPIQFYCKSNCIRALKHDVYNITIKKKSLNGVQYKRFDLASGKSLPFGHKDIPLYQG